MRKFLILLLCAVIFSGCATFKKGKRKQEQKTDLTVYIDSELNQFFGELDAQSKTMRAP